MTAAEVLLAAAALVERGWCQHQLHTRAPERWCAIGAITSAARYAGCAGSEFSACDVLKQVVPIDDIAGWNDAPERTQAEVVAALRAAAAAASATDAAAAEGGAK